MGRLGQKVGLFLLEQLDGLFSGFAVDADVGDFIQPDCGGGIDGVEVREVEAGEEIFLHIPDSVFHPSFFVSFADVTRGDGETVGVGKVEIGGVEDGRLPGDTSENRGLQIVDHDLSGNRAEVIKGVLMTGEEVLHGLGDGEFEIHHAAVAEHHDEEAESSRG